MASSTVFIFLLWIFIVIPKLTIVHSQGNLPINVHNPQCAQEVSGCVPLDNGTRCFGMLLPFTHTSLELVDDSRNQSEVQERLTLWRGLQNVPKCWEIVQPFLCATYLPKCTTHNGSSFIELSGRELCERTREPCKIVQSTAEWPAFLQCNSPHFPSACESKAYATDKVTFNTTGSCERPLVPTANKHSWYGDVEGCGIQCQNPLFTDAEHYQMHIIIAVFATLCFVCTLFTVLTFVIDWKNANRYPALILFFINLCFCVGSGGWLAQFLPGMRTDIVCKRDGTMRVAEPQVGSGETASCALVFVIVYYFMIAGITWFVILTYAWHLTFGALGSARDVIHSKRAHFHIAAWSVPLVLTIACLAVTQIDGDSLSGICFVGYQQHMYRGLFVLAPVGLVLFVGLIFMVKGLVSLIRIQINSPGLISDKASARIRDTIIRLGIFAGCAFAFVVITFIVHVYIFTNEPKWRSSFDQYIICKANVTIAKTLSNSTSGSCQLSSRPNLVAMVIHILAYFGSGIVMSSWAWNRATRLAWRRFFRKMFNLPNDEPVKLKKHQVIAQAFRKRQELKQAGRLSLSFASTHDDPLGMRFDIASVTSAEMSSAWAAAIPRMVLRRGAMAQPKQRRYSDSDVESIQSTCQKLGLEFPPRRVSLESPGSQEEGGVDARHRGRKHHGKKTRRKHRTAGKNRVGPQIGGSRPNEVYDDRHRGSYTSSKTASITNISAISSKLSTNTNTNTNDFDSEDSYMTTPPATGSRVPRLPVGRTSSRGSSKASSERPATGNVRSLGVPENGNSKHQRPPVGAGYNIFTASYTTSSAVGLRVPPNSVEGSGKNNDKVEEIELQDLIVEAPKMPKKAKIHRSHRKEEVVTAEVVSELEPAPKIKKRRKRRKLPDFDSDESDVVTKDRRTSTPKDLHTDIESFIEAKIEEDSLRNSVQILTIEPGGVNGECGDDDVFDSEDSNMTPPTQRPFSTGTFTKIPAITKVLDLNGDDVIDSDDSRLLTPPPQRPDRYGPLGSSQTTPTKENTSPPVHVYSSPPRVAPNRNHLFSEGIHQITSPGRHRVKKLSMTNPVWSRFMLDNVSLASPPESRCRSPEERHAGKRAPKYEYQESDLENRASENGYENRGRAPEHGYNHRNRRAPDRGYEQSSNRAPEHGYDQSSSRAPEHGYNQNSSRAPEHGYNQSSRAPEHGYQNKDIYGHSPPPRPNAPEQGYGMNAPEPGYSNEGYAQEEKSQKSPGGGLHNMYY